METPSIRSGTFERLNDDVLRLILKGLYEACLRDFERLETREKRNKAVKKLLPLGYTCRNFAKWVLPYVWKYVRIVTSSRIERSHNVIIYEILKNDNLLFPYGEYLKELEINFTVYSGDEHYSEIPTISSLLQVVANRCTNIQQLSFTANIERNNNANEFIRNEGAIINQAFQRAMQTKTRWNDFRDLVSKAFGQGTLTNVTLSSDFILMDDECLIDIAQNNKGIKKLSIKGSQFSFTHEGMETALQHLGSSLKELEIYNLDGSTRSSPLRISIDSLLRPCRSLQSIHLVGIKYRSDDDSEECICPLQPLQSIKADQVDEETLNRLFSTANVQTLSQVSITSLYDAVRWDSFLCSSILPFATGGSLENLTLLMLRCQNHQYSSRELKPKIIMKNIMNTLQISESTAKILCSKLKQWKVFVGRDTGDFSYSVESEAVDFVSEECILNYDRMALSEYSFRG